MDRFSRFATALLIAATVPVHADYWSLASFSSEENGMKGLARLSDSVPGAVLAESGGRYRVLVEKSASPDAQKSALETEGYWPWTVYAADVDRVLTHTGNRLTTRHYLVAGSFTNERSAQTFMKKLQSDGRDSAEIQMAEVAGAIHYRVTLGPYDSRSMADTDFSAYGIDSPWWMTVTVESMVAEQIRDDAADDEPAYVAEETVSVAVDMDVEEEPVYTITPPAANESYVDYCLRKANAMERSIYCKNDDFNRIAAAEVQAAGDSDKASLLNCALQSRDGTMQDCRRGK